MHKLLIIMVATILVAAGCVKYAKSDAYDVAWTRHGNYVETKVVDIEGHKYIITTLGASAVDLEHAASCMHPDHKQK